MEGKEKREDRPVRDSGDHSLDKYRDQNGKIDFRKVVKDMRGEGSCPRRL